MEKLDIEERDFGDESEEEGFPLLKESGEEEEKKPQEKELGNQKIPSRTQSVSFKRSVLDFMNLFKAFIGTNYLSLPFAFSQAGWLFGIILLILIAIATEHCCNLIVTCKEVAVLKVLRHEKEKDPTARRKKEDIEREMQYEDIGMEAVGRKGHQIVQALLVFTQAGFCTGYTIFIGSTLHELFPSVPLVLLVLSPLPVFIACSFVNDVRKFSSLSALANVFILMGFASVVGYIVITFETGPNVKSFRFLTAPIFFGNVVSAFEGIGLIIPIHSSMKGNRHRYHGFLRTVICVIGILLCTFGVLGYLRFGDKTPQIITEVLPMGSLLMQFVQVGLILGICFTYPLQIWPVIVVAESRLLSRVQRNRDLSEPRKCISPRQILIRTSIVILTGCLGVVFRNDFGFFTSLIGAIGSSALAFVLPSWFHIRLLSETGTLTKFQRNKNIALMLIGVICAIIGTVVCIMNLV
eukprot:TRINITY_DN119_c0_g3_i1.p1 TRINITY_DN119_c0_g3~~TRINITY_DN119_c0_g3_i1.p1  ORF type:complete len:508 (-),score=118.75 TRINITY_DN119_c0_g3_i1:1394-2791(-)